MFPKLAGLLVHCSFNTAKAKDRTLAEFLGLQTRLSFSKTLDPQCCWQTVAVMGSELSIGPFQDLWESREECLLLGLWTLRTADRQRH